MIKIRHLLVELNIIENPNKWAIPEGTESANDTDIDLDGLIDSIIERNIGAYKKLKDL